MPKVYTSNGASSGGGGGSYLPLAGGTMTGAVNGTSFSLNVGATGSLPTGNPIVNITNAADTAQSGLALTNVAGKTCYFNNSVGGDGFAIQDNSGFTFLNYVFTTNFIALGVEGSAGNDPRYPVSFNSGQFDWSPYTQLVPNAGYSSAAVMACNTTTTTGAGAWMGYGTTGGSFNPMSYWGTNHIVQTSGSEQANWHLIVTNSGTMTDCLTVYGQTGNVVATQGALGTNCPQTTLTGSAGTAVCSQPFQGTSHKKVVVYLSGYTDTGTQTYTFPTAFTHTPYIYGLTAGVAGATVTATTIKFTITTQTGFVFCEGF